MHEIAPQTQSQIWIATAGQSDTVIEMTPSLALRNSSAKSREHKLLSLSALPVKNFEKKKKNGTGRK